MANFIKLVYATLNNEGIDTSNMSTDDAVAKFNKLQKRTGGESGEKEGTPAENRKLEQKGIVENPHKNWSGVNTITQAKKVDKDIVEKKIAANILFSYGDLNLSDEELANKVDKLQSKMKYDTEKVKNYIKNNIENKGKIFGSYREISENFK